MKEKEIGSQFLYNRTVLEVQPSESCCGCYFNGKPFSCLKNKRITGPCAKEYRKDNVDVIFKKVIK